MKYNRFNKLEKFKILTNKIKFNKKGNRIKKLKKSKLIKIFQYKYLNQMKIEIVTVKKVKILNIKLIYKLI